MNKVVFFLFLISFSAPAQLLKEASDFTKKDSLRGGLRFERTCFNVLHYDLDIKINPDKKYISGSNTITYEVVEPTQKIQLDLYENLQIDSIVLNKKTLDFERIYNAVFVDFEEELNQNEIYKIEVFYQGHPTVAKRAPWDGGFDFSKDHNGNHFIGVAVQGDGASLWYPNKDHLSDEPENGASIKVSVPNGLMNVSNGRLIEEIPQDNNYTKWHWEVTNPINNYNITVNIGKYVNFKDQYKNLDLDYYVLEENLDVAKVHFEQVHGMMDCFYEKFGEYPFIEDSFKLVETPYLGMEHQSCVAYGNQYNFGYMGNDLSGTGKGLDWDFIIIHESGHEWFGNSVSVADIADLWVHEGFTTYSEGVYIECKNGYDDAMEYLYGIRRNIENKRPLIGNYNVNHSGPGDIYYKGANMINTLRAVVNDDELWWKSLKNFAESFKHQITNTDKVIDFFNQELNHDYSSFFDQYLNFAEIPVLMIRKKGRNKVQMKWKAEAKEFEMPIFVSFIEEDQVYKINLDRNWTTTDLKMKDLRKLRIDNFTSYYDIEYIDEE